MHSSYIISQSNSVLLPLNILGLHYELRKKSKSIKMVIYPLVPNLLDFAFSYVLIKSV